jgi:hypothetical protein
MDSIESTHVCLVPDCGRDGTHRAPGGLLGQWLCCGHFEQFVGHVLDPVQNPVFPLPLI